jgi:hypothetical protein
VLPFTPHLLALLLLATKENTMGKGHGRRRRREQSVLRLGPGRDLCEGENDALSDCISRRCCKEGKVELTLIQ